MATFSRRRGRPRRAKPSHDTGTPELVAKRRAHLTSEPIDLCLSRNIVTTAQHRAGIHLRWLHTLRLGAPGVKALDIERSGASSTRTTDEVWLADRQQEYNHAVQELTIFNRLSPVVDLCIYNISPSFLFPPSGDASLHIPLRRVRDRQELCEGLDILRKLWENRHNQTP